MSVLSQLIADLELGLILWVALMVWLVLYGPRTVRKALRRWLGGDRDDRWWRRYQAAERAKAKAAFKGERIDLG